MTRLLLPLLALPASLLLSGCCCCNLGSWLPEDAEDQFVEGMVERGVEAATGTKIDSKDGRFEIEGPDGEKLVVGEGHAGVDPRIPITGHPGCPVAGGLTAEANGEFMGSMVQGDCTVPFDDMVAHYTKQFEALGATPTSVVQTSSSEGRGKLLQAEKGERFKTLSVIIGEESNGTTSAAVSVVVDTKK